MFMRENRKKNGAPQPEATMREDAGAQNAAKKLDPNQGVENSPPDWRFQVDLSTPAAINHAHYNAGISSIPALTNYISHIPFVGTEAAGEGAGERALADHP